MVQTKKPVKQPETIETKVEYEYDSSKYESYFNDEVRVYSVEQEILPGVFTEKKFFRVFLNKEKKSYLEFREPSTKECINFAESSAKTAKPGEINGMADSVLTFFETLSVGEIVASPVLVKKLPIKYYSMIMTTLNNVCGFEVGKLF